MPHQCTNCGRTFPDGSKEMLSGCPDCGGNKFKFDPASRGEEGDPGSKLGGGSASPPEHDSRPESERDPTPGLEGDSASGGGSDSSPADSSAGDADPTDDEPFADYEWPDTASTEPPDAHDKTGPAGRPTISSDDSPSTDTAAPSDDPDPADTTASPPSSEREFEYTSAAERSEAERSPNTATDRPGAQSGQHPHADVETTTDREPDAEDSAQASARSEVVSGEELPEYADSDDATPTSDHSPTSDEPPESAAPPEAGDPEFERMREELNQQFESIRIVRPGEYELNLVELYDREEFIISLREDGRYVIEMPDAWDTDTE